jgi:acylphosphatase
MKNTHIIVHGLVQGVFFRKHTQEKAVEFDINGFVRNCADGTVEIEAEGDENGMRKFIEWCHHGPPGAKVTHIDMHEQGLKNYSFFKIIR